MFSFNLNKSNQRLYTVKRAAPIKVKIIAADFELCSLAIQSFDNPEVQIPQCTAMSTLQKSRQKENIETKVDTWKKIFPTKVETQQASLTYVKKLLTVGVSSITYLRSMFPEEAYTQKNLNGLTLKILK